MILYYLFFSDVSRSTGVSPDRISSGESLLQSQTIVSNGSIFELGFFSPGNSTNYYIGIWFKNVSVQTVVWVANRDNPLTSSSVANSSLVLSDDTLNLYTGGLRDQNIIWSTLSLTSDDDDESNSTEAILLDTGNLVIRGRSGIIWQSFDYPTDTCLPGGRIGLDKVSNRSIILTSWRNNDDPGSGIYSLGINGSEMVMRRNLTTQYWRSGPWNGVYFSLLPQTQTGALATNYTYNYITTDQIDYMTFNFSGSAPTRVVINSLGLLQTSIWFEQTQEWFLYISEPVDNCGVFETCGPFGVCNVNSTPICNCLPGFEPRFPRSWDLSEFSSGCVRINPLTCNANREGFVRLTDVLPADSQSLPYDNSQICEFACSINCTCNAYSVSSSGGGCLLWHGDLSDLQNRTNTRHFFLKLDGVGISNDDDLQNRLLVAISVSVALAILILACVLCFVWLRRRKLKQKGSYQEKREDLLLLNVDCNSQSSSYNSDKSGDGQHVIELPMFSFSSISIATGNFSLSNKLGEGGFGPVYKGTLLNGQSVAVKRLSKMSGQGLEELRNEAILIAKLQHKNLVRLLGCCTEKDEKILIYEYLPNKSLDFFLFDSVKRELLNWSVRVRIIDGIAQGLLYLHEHSRLRIVHRDLKASNILLDGNMKPKISDFGMARIFGGNELQAITNRIVGTYGYMSPEYAMQGHFSVKSDVFAFGVLLLEILSGEKIANFHHSDFTNLLEYAWTLWENKRALKFFDPILQVPHSSSMPLRYMFVGLLCVQESPDDRPTISEVLAMLSNELIGVKLKEVPLII
jgi:serine/threonine protein kinase